MAQDKVELLASIYESAFKSTQNLAAKIPAEKRMRQLQKGKPHPLWLIGHLANSNNMVVNMWCCGGQSMFPKEWRDKFAPDFGGGIPPTNDAAFYPDWDEVLKVYGDVAEACLASIRSLSDDDLNGEFKGKVPDAAKKMFGGLEAALRNMAGHESHHRGQMAMINALD